MADEFYIYEITYKDKKWHKQLLLYQKNNTIADFCSLNNTLYLITDAPLKPITKHNSKLPFQNQESNSKTKEHYFSAFQPETKKVKVIQKIDKGFYHITTSTENNTIILASHHTILRYNLTTRTFKEPIYSEGIRDIAALNNLLYINCRASLTNRYNKDPKLVIYDMKKKTILTEIDGYFGKFSYVY